MVGNQALRKMIEILESMTPRTKAPADGRGVFLGTGVPEKTMRSNDLADALRDLYMHRTGEHP